MQDAEKLREKAFAMFAEGQKINPVAKQLLKGNWPKAKALYAEWQAEQGGESNGLHLARSGETVEIPDAWDLEITVPTTRLDHIFTTFTAQEKATAIQGVLQVRMDAALGLEA